ncbi:MAG: PilZ domain-containing protein [Sandaracinaceae bacterium]|nr:PilZ domain-containing protein [Sandaracinaceae bacterium]
MLQTFRRRRALRRGVSLRCQAVLIDPFRHVGTRLVDLSHQGAMLDCDVALVEGDELILSFEIGAQVVDTVAEVKNVTWDLRRAGLAFTEMDWESRVALFVGLAGVPPKAPLVRPAIDYATTVRRIALA